MSKRRHQNSEFKAVISADYAIHPFQLSSCKKQLPDGAASWPVTDRQVASTHELGHDLL